MTLSKWIIMWEDPLYADTLSATFDWDDALDFLGYLNAEGSRHFELERVDID